jgi:hypothetical protein
METGIGCVVACDRYIDKFLTLQPARGAYVVAMGPIASLRSLWTFPHIRRMGSPGGELRLVLVRARRSRQDGDMWEIIWRCANG